MPVPLILVLFFAVSVGASAKAPKDALFTLQESSSPVATTELSKMLTRSHSPYARLWVVNALYERVRSHQDEDALAELVKAAKDRNLDVRRRALTSLEAFEFLPASTIDPKWLTGIRSAAMDAQKDKDKEIRAAGVQLLQAAQDWQKKNGKPVTKSHFFKSTDSSEDSPGFWSRMSLSQGLGLLVWLACFHFLAFAWQELSVRLLKDSGPVGAAVISQWRKCRKRSDFILFPGAACFLLLLSLGGALAYGLLSFAAPGDGPLEAADLALAAGGVIAVYLVSTVLAFAPAASLAAYAAGSKSAGFRAVFRRHHAIVWLGVVMMVGVWPWELLLKLFKREIKGTGLWAWSARTGAPLAGALAAAYMVSENLGWREAWRKAAQRHGRLTDPAAAFFGTTLFHPQFLFPAMAAPVFCGLSLLPAVGLADFSLSQLMDWWFVTDAMSIVGFGLWAGGMMAAAYLAVLWCLGALYAAEVVHG